MPPHCKENDYDFGDVPPELSCLSPIEIRMISRVIPHVALLHFHFHTHGFEGIRSKGHSMSFANDIQKTVVDTLPRHFDPSSTGYYLIGKESLSIAKEFVKKRKFFLSHIHNALQWLKRNNTKYNDIIIDNTYINELATQLEKEDLDAIEIEQQNTEPTNDSSNNNINSSEYIPVENASSVKLCNAEADLDPRYFEPPDEEQSVNPIDQMKKLFAKDTINVANYGVSNSSIAVSDSISSDVSGPDSAQSSDPFIVRVPAGNRTSAVDEKTMGIRTLMCMAFPLLFPNGQCGKSSLGTRGHVYEKAEFRHYLMCYHDGRFARNSQFVFWLYNRLMRNRSFTVASLASKSMGESGKYDSAAGAGAGAGADGASAGALLTLAQVKGALDVHLCIEANDSAGIPQHEQDNAMKLLNRLKTFIHALPGTAAYMLNERSNLLSLASSTELGHPTLFFTLSAPDLWPQHMRLFTSLSEYAPVEKPKFRSEEERALFHSFTASQINEMIKDNPVFPVIHFHDRLQALWKNILDGLTKPFGKIIGYFKRIEFQQRGTPHLHAELWIEGFTNIVNEAQQEEGKRKILEYVQRTISAQSDIKAWSDHPAAGTHDPMNVVSQLPGSPDHTQKQQTSPLRDGREGESEKDVEMNVGKSDSCLLSFLPSHMKQTEQTKKSIPVAPTVSSLSSPPKVPLPPPLPSRAVLRDDIIADHLHSGPQEARVEALIASSQRHRHVKSCVKGKRGGVVPSNSSCRYHFPRQVRDSTTVDFDEKDPTRPKIVVKLGRTDQWINNYNPFIMAAWCANHDVSVIMNDFAAITYVCKYITKQDVGDGGTSFTSFIRKKLSVLPQDSNWMKQLLAVSRADIAFHEIGLQEALWHLLSFPLVEKSHEIIKVDVRKVAHDKDGDVLFINPELIRTTPDTATVQANGIASRRGRILNYECRPLTEEFNNMHLADFTSKYLIEPAKTFDKLSTADAKNKRTKMEGQREEFYVRPRQEGKFAIVVPVPPTRIDNTNEASCFFQLLFYTPFRDVSTLITQYSPEGNAVEAFRIACEQGKVPDHLIPLLHIQRDLQAVIADRTDHRVEETYDYKIPADQFDAMMRKEDYEDEAVEEAQNEETNAEADAHYASLPVTLSCVEGYNPLVPLIPFSEVGRHQDFIQYSHRSAGPSSLINKSDTFLHEMKQQLSLDLKANRETVEQGRDSKEHQQRLHDTLYSKLNLKQTLALQHVKDHLVSDAKQLLMIIHGDAGTGKSFLCDAIVSYVRTQIGTTKFDPAAPHVDTVYVLAFTGKAAHNIKGYTIHHAFHLRPGASNKITFALLKELEHLSVLIIDEFSMISLKMLQTISSTIQQAKKDFNRPFGGVHVVFFGDPYQLPPVQGRSVFADCWLQDAQEKKGREVWLQFNVAVELTEQQRQRGPEQQIFAEVLGRARTGEIHNPEDIVYLNDRYRSKDELYEHCFASEDTLWLTYTKAWVSQINASHTLALSKNQQTPIVNIFAQHALVIPPHTAARKRKKPSVQKSVQPKPSLGKQLQSAFGLSKRVAVEHGGNISDEEEQKRNYAVCDRMVEPDTVNDLPIEERIESSSNEAQKKRKPSRAHSMRMLDDEATQSKEYDDEEFEDEKQESKYETADQLSISVNVAEQLSIPVNFVDQSIIPTNADEEIDQQENAAQTYFADRSIPANLRRQSNIKPEDLLTLLSITKNSKEDSNKLLPCLQLTVGSRVVLTKNLCVPLGLVNGSTGTVHSVLYDTDSIYKCRPTESLKHLTNKYFARGEQLQIPVVVVKFDEVYFGQNKTSFLPGTDRLFPILAETCIVEYSGKKYHRTQLPLQLSFATTIHKIQGSTLNRVVFDSTGIQQRHKGLAYVACSRVRSLEGLFLAQKIGEAHFMSKDDQNKIKSQVTIEVERWRQMERNDFIESIVRDIQDSDLADLDHLTEIQSRWKSEKATAASNADVPALPLSSSKVHLAVSSSTTSVASSIPISTLFVCHRQKQEESLVESTYPSTHLLSVATGIVSTALSSSFISSFPSSPSLPFATLPVVASMAVS